MHESSPSVFILQFTEYKYVNVFVHTNYEKHPSGIMISPSELCPLGTIYDNSLVTFPIACTHPYINNYVYHIHTCISCARVISMN